MQIFTPSHPKNRKNNGVGGWSKDGNAWLLLASTSPLALPWVFNRFTSGLTEDWVKALIVTATNKCNSSVHNDCCIEVTRRAVMPFLAEECLSKPSLCCLLLNNTKLFSNDAQNSANYKKARSAWMLDDSVSLSVQNLIIECQILACDSNE